MKYLIINADDFGYSKVFNESILDLIENDLISSTTAMINWINKDQINQVKKLIELQKNHNISIGLHLEFNDTNFDEEIQKQFNKFIKIFDFKPSHIDIHKPNFSNKENPSVQKFCEKNNLHCRNLNIKNTNMKMTTNEVLNGTNMSLEELKNWTKNLNEGESYEILFHPGKYDKHCKSSLNEKRELDIEKIKKIKPILEENQIKLISYKNLN